MKYKIHIQKHSIVLLLMWCVSWLGIAQQTAQVGDTTTLSVNGVSGDTYLWELYDYVQDVNFAITQGNCPNSKAYFVNGNTGFSTQVKWLEPGTYYYKVTVNNGCSNNVKIGEIVISEAEVPPTPKIVVIYNCDEGTATLKATEYQGDLLWSTGETSETIQVTQQGVYTLTQTVNNQQSTPASVSIENTQAPNAPTASVTPTSIELGESATLVAEGCSNGTLIWYSDEQLTQEVENTELTPLEENTYTYYAVCKSKTGCESPYTEVILIVKPKDPCPELLETMQIPQGISPNGDGENDTWDIEDLKTYCDTCEKEAKVMIFNRLGSKIYEQNSYMLNNKRFKGYSQNKLTLYKENKLPVGTYFYVIEVEGKFVKSGYIYINY